MRESRTHIVVAGASGRTGRLVVEQALRAGHRVTALVRDPRSVTLPPEATVIRADLVRGEEVGIPRNADVVISTLGKRSNRDRTPVCAAGTQHLLDAMRRSGVRRLVVTSASPVLRAGTGEPAWFRWTVRPLVRWFGRRIYADLEDMEALVRRSSDVDWSIVRPGYLVDRPAGRFELVPEENATGVVHRADLAAALLSVAARGDVTGVAFGLASRPSPGGDA